MKDNGQFFVEFSSNQKKQNEVTVLREEFMLQYNIGQVITLYIGMEAESHKRTSGDETSIIVSRPHSSLGSFQVENDQNNMQEGNSQVENDQNNRQEMRRLLLFLRHIQNNMQEGNSQVENDEAMRRNNMQEENSSGDETSTIVSSRHSSEENDQNFWHTTLNIIVGMMGLMSLPFALANGGWVGLSVLIVFGITFWFAANLLTQCLESLERHGHGEASNYRDIGEAAFRKRGRIITTILLHAEIFLILVAYTISLIDSLKIIFHQAKFGNISIRHVVALVAIKMVSLTLGVKNMRSIAILSLVGILSTLLVISTVVWEAAFGGVGTSYHIPTFQIQHIPIASVIYIFYYGGSQVFPNIYRAMKNPTQFSKGGNSLIILSMPRHTTAAKISLWATVINPISKYALQIVPVIDELESVFLRLQRRFGGSNTREEVRDEMSYVIVVAVLAVAISLPYFGYFERERSSWLIRYFHSGLSSRA
eukprot:Gb_00874 [translate_table: standard]